MNNSCPYPYKPYKNIKFEHLYYLKRRGYGYFFVEHSVS